MLRSLLRSLTAKHRYRRTFIGSMYRYLRGRPFPLDVDHLMSYAEEDAMGPIQRSEALLLYSVVLVTQPRLIVEFGFNVGDSAWNFLQAAGPRAVLHSYDISDYSREAASKRFIGESRFTYHGKSQTDFDPADINNQKIDLVFFDAAHDLALNQETWKKVLPHLSASALVAIHDTGTWNRDHLREVHSTFIAKENGVWLNEQEYAHQIDERRFVNWIVDQHPSFSAVHFHSLNVVRHGLTIMQNQTRLSV